jgi:hypothetical protein
MTAGLQHASAFLVQFRGSELGSGPLPGRVEHVATGRTATFQSVEELPQILLSMLKRVASDRGNESA